MVGKGRMHEGSDAGWEGGMRKSGRGGKEGRKRKRSHTRIKRKNEHFNHVQLFKNFRSSSCVMNAKINACLRRRHARGGGKDRMEKGRRLNQSR